MFNSSGGTCRLMCTRKKIELVMVPTERAYRQRDAGSTQGRPQIPLFMAADIDFVHYMG